MSYLTAMFPMQEESDMHDNRISEDGHERRATAVVVLFGLVFALGACSSNGGTADAGFCAEVREAKTALGEFESAVTKGDVESLRQRSPQLAATLRDLAERAPGNVDGALGEYRDAYAESDQLLASNDYEPDSLTDDERERILEPELGGDAADDVDEFLDESCE